MANAKDKQKDPTEDRRRFFKRLFQGAGLLGLGAVAGAVGSRADAEEMVWQIDPWTCTACGKCATECVLDPSAVRCVHSFQLCGYCDYCVGFFEPNIASRDSGAENQLCPTNALTRAYVDDPYFEYTVDEDECIGCGICVEGCTKYGNGSLYMQIRHDICVQCNECAIAVACPSDAIKRIPAGLTYLHKTDEQKKSEQKK